MVLLLEISTPCKVQAEWPRMDVIVLTLVLSSLVMPEKKIDMIENEQQRM